ncbi:MAG: acylphosphatase [Planctomycetes bacterium]|nr:acylphosphatase [Planctomycetota bacterium]
MSDALERREVTYEGHVQGVGFRFTTVQIARRFEVGGYVKNLPDGRVELVAEGKPKELDAFLAAVADAMRGNIRKKNVTTLAASGEFREFDVRH